MNLEALLLAGMPPVGRGVFARSSVPLGPWRWVAVAADNRAQQNVDEARRRGLEVWLYRGADAFQVGNWRATLAEMVRIGRALNVPRLIPDPESMGHDAGAMAALGAELALLANDFRICVTSYPDVAHLDLLLAPLGERVSGLVQIYARTSQSPSDWRVWFNRWVPHFGARLSIVAAAWQAGPSQANETAYQHYLANLPHSAGAGFWYASSPPAWMLAAISNYEPGGSFVGTYAYAARAYAARPVGVGTIAGVVLLVLVVFLAAGGLRAA